MQLTVDVHIINILEIFSFPNWKREKSEEGVRVFGVQGWSSNIVDYVIVNSREKDIVIMNLLDSKQNSGFYLRIHVEINICEILRPDPKVTLPAEPYTCGHCRQLRTRTLTIYQLQFRERERERERER